MTFYFLFKENKSNLLVTVIIELFCVILRGKGKPEELLSRTVSNKVLI